MYLPLGLLRFYTIVSPLSKTSVDKRDICPLISYPGRAVGTITNPEINEASALLASQTNPYTFWTLNDSQGVPCLFAVSFTGQTLYKLCLDGATNFDWEALSTAACEPGSSEMCLYVGDVGDNEKIRDNISVYKVKEPKIDPLLSYVVENTDEWTVRNYTYPTGAHNCESMMIDPNTRDLVFVTKSLEYPFAEVYHTLLDNNETSSTDTVLTEAGITITLPDATDATISADGQVVIIRLYMGAFLWPRNAQGEQRPLLEILKEPQCLISVGLQKQGEGVALSPSGTSYYVHSEGVGENILQYNILN